MPMNRSKYSRSTASTLAAARRLGESDMRHAERRGIAAEFREPLEQRRVGRTRQQRRQKRVFLRARRVDFVDVARHVSAEQIGTQHRRGSRRLQFDREHAFGRDTIPVRDRRLRDSYFAREFAHAANGADRFLQSWISHRALAQNPGSRIQIRTVRNRTAGKDIGQ